MKSRFPCKTALLVSALLSLPAPVRTISTQIHLYDPARPEGISFPPMDSPLYRTTLPAQYDDVAIPAGVTGAIVEEASNRLEDNQWVLKRIRDLPRYLGLVGALDPGTTGFSNHLLRFSSDPKFLGIRLRSDGIQENRGFADATPILAIFRPLLFYGLNCLLHAFEAGAHRNRVRR